MRIGKRHVLVGILVATLVVVAPFVMTVNADTNGYSPSAASDVYFIYKPWYNTADYECWDSSDKSTLWQGTSELDGHDTVQNAGVARQGSVVHFKGTGGSASSAVSIEGPKPFSGSRATITDWTPVHVSGEEWKVTIPGDADIGDYKVHMDSEYATLYVIFDIMKHKNDFSLTNWKTWGYDETTIADEYSWAGVNPYLQAHSHAYEQRMVEFTCSIMGAGVNTELEAASKLAIVVENRITWSTNPLHDSHDNNVDTMNLLDGSGLDDYSGTITYPSISVTDART